MPTAPLQESMPRLPVISFDAFITWIRHFLDSSSSHALLSARPLQHDARRYFRALLQNVPQLRASARGTIEIAPLCSALCT